MYGWRARLGVLVPSAIVVTEPEFNLMTPEGVSIHYHRTAFRGGNMKDLEKAEAGIVDAIELLTHIQPSAIAISGTALSFVGGYASDKKLIEKIKEKYGDIPATTTSTAVIEALNRFGVKKVAIATPYMEDVARAAAKFVQDSGIEVLNINWRNKKTALETGEIPLTELPALVAEVETPESDAILISCTALHTVAAIESLEKEFQKPVVTSNQATMWHLLRLVNVNDKIEGYGQLFREF